MAAVLLAVVPVTPAQAASAAPAPDKDGRNAQDAPDAAQLRERLELARQQAWHLVLDLERAELRLMLGGAPLRAFPFSRSAVGAPRRAFVGGDVPADWATRTWTGGRLDPARDRERVEIVPQPGNTQAASLPPPEPGPATYSLRFADGLEILIDGDGEGIRETTSLGTRLRLLAAPGETRLRVRLNLTLDDARGLYACLPPEFALVVQGQPRR